MRPEGWKNPYEDIPDSVPSDRVGIVMGKGIGYEEGADAYEEGLKKEGIPPDVYADFLRWGLERGMENKTIGQDKVATYKGRKGTLVFIEVR